jgi:hypothetical protein
MKDPIKWEWAENWRGVRVLNANRDADSKYIGYGYVFGCFEKGQRRFSCHLINKARNHWLGATPVHNFREGIAFIENAYRLGMTGDDLYQL